MLSTREVADRLGVKPETVYAYVSRGLLTSTPKPGGRGSLFDVKEVDAFLRRGRRPRPSGSPDGAPAGGETIRTGITLVDVDRYYFRGVDAVDLADRFSFEEAARWLWTGQVEPGAQFFSRPETVVAARRAVAALPPHSGLLDALRVATVAASVTDPVRFDLSDETVSAGAASLIATLIAALPALSGMEPVPRPAATSAAGLDADTGQAGVALRLWRRLTEAPANEAWLECLDAALVLLIDHDLAASTLAARVAASARANPYAVVSAALGALEGPLHGAASGLAHKMLMEVQSRGSAAAVVSEYPREGRRIPGLGHRLYPGVDPRAAAMFARLSRIPAAAPIVEIAHDIADTAARHAPLHANIDLALAVMSVSSGMPADAGECIFAIARTVGWVAHALEEYQERPLRMRPSGHYIGPRPPQPLPPLPVE
jgi:citrate synthase